MCVIGVWSLLAGIISFLYVSTVSGPVWLCSPITMKIKALSRFTPSMWSFTGVKVKTTRFLRLTIKFNRLARLHFQQKSKLSTICTSFSKISFWVRHQTQGLDLLRRYCKTLCQKMKQLSFKGVLLNVSPQMRTLNVCDVTWVTPWEVLEKFSLCFFSFRSHEATSLPLQRPCLQPSRGKLGHRKDTSDHHHVWPEQHRALLLLPRAEPPPPRLPWLWAAPLRQMQHQPARQLPPPCWHDRWFLCKPHLLVAVCPRGTQRRNTTGLWNRILPDPRHCCVQVAPPSCDGVGKVPGLWADLEALQVFLCQLYSYFWAPGWSRWGRLHVHFQVFRCCALHQRRGKQ